MNVQQIHLYGLIGLRALAEFDPSEYHRAVDMSKRELERTIETILREAPDDIKDLYNELKTIIDTTENPIEMSYLLQQIYTASFLKAHYYATERRRDRLEEIPSDFYVTQDDSEQQWSKIGVETKADEFLKLSAMCLLRHLREYTPIFNVHLKDVEVDCVLEPNLADLPHIVIEAKNQILNVRQLEDIIKQVKSAKTAHGKRTIGAVILGRAPKSVTHTDTPRKDIYLLIFDVIKNRFVGTGLLDLINRVQPKQ
jgi:hypothetical protein